MTFRHGDRRHPTPRLVAYVPKGRHDPQSGIIARNATNLVDLRHEATRTTPNREADWNFSRTKAMAAHARLTPLIVRMAASGLTLDQIADDLNTAGNRTRRGAPFRDATVWRILSRVGSHAGSRRR
jgi:hypothetical protein